MLQQSYEAKVAEIHSEWQNRMEEIQKRAEAKDRMLRQIEGELGEEKRNSILKIEALERDLQNAKESLNSSQKLYEMQEFDMTKLKQTLEEYKNEVNIVQRGSVLLEEENRRLTQDKEDLSDSIRRLERIVYGKTF